MPCEAHRAFDEASKNRRLGAGLHTPAAKHASLALRWCPLLNISVCAPSVAATAGGQGFSVVAYNPLAWERREPLRLPVSGEGPWAVIGGRPPIVLRE